MMMIYRVYEWDNVELKHGGQMRPDHGNPLSGFATLRHYLVVVGRPTNCFRTKKSFSRHIELKPETGKWE